MPRGRILRGRTEKWSGIMMLDLQDIDGEDIIVIPCEAGPTIRALHDAFVSRGKNPVGEIIDYEVDDLGVMTQFWPSGGQENGPPKVANPERAGGEETGTEPSGEDA